MKNLIYILILLALFSCEKQCGSAKPLALDTIQIDRAWLLSDGAGKYALWVTSDKPLLDSTEVCFTWELKWPSADSIPLRDTFTFPGTQYLSPAGKPEVYYKTGVPILPVNPNPSQGSGAIRKVKVEFMKHKKPGVLLVY